MILTSPVTHGISIQRQARCAIICKIKILIAKAIVALIFQARQAHAVKYFHIIINVNFSWNQYPVRQLKISFVNLFPWG